MPWLSKQTDRTDGGWVQSTFGAKAEQTDRQTDRTGGLENLPKSDVYQSLKTAQKTVQKNISKMFKKLTASLALPNL